LDLTETALRECVKRAEADEGKGAPDTPTTAHAAQGLEKRLRRRLLPRGRAPVRFFERDR
jgi:hypothetical protein